MTGADGAAKFRTIWPVSYSRYLLLQRPPHLHVRVLAPGRDDGYEIEVPGVEERDDGVEAVSITLLP